MITFKKRRKEEEKSCKWDERFLRLAFEVSGWSKDPSTKVGCVLVNDLKQVIGIGYNGFPRGVFDSQGRLHDREEKYRFVLHAEENAIFNATTDIKGSTAYVTHAPCNHCMAALAQNGIKRVVTNEILETWRERFPDSYRVADEIRKECSIEFIELKIKGA